VTPHATLRFSQAMEKANLYKAQRCAPGTFHVRKKFQVATGKGSIDEARTVRVTKDLMQVVCEVLHVTLP